MILLDTNYLIRMLVRGSSEALAVAEWLRGGEDLCTATIAWYEFLAGPIDDEAKSLVRRLVKGRILPFTEQSALLSAKLFNQTGRLRRLRVDAMIAAVAIEAGATLATANLNDFEPFQQQGLVLMRV